ncbi:uncharacterized protein LOC131666983 [Phymastichus coffea]|uniref:uncharacterized protein LOC131666983 n=1 Tax=Phymastichus coffea TaxID=108790 RepID=UPI00273B5F4F|nr:uncharacterized protein LOC131666983 [Phymastichus coffea]
MAERVSTGRHGGPADDAVRGARRAGRGRLQRRRRGSGPDAAAVGGRAGHAGAVVPHNRHDPGQLPGDPERVHLPTAAHRAELLHRVAGGGGPGGGDPRDALQRRLPHPRQVGVRHPPVQALADLRRAVLHGEHPKPVRDSPRPVLGHHRPHQLRAEAHAQARARHHRRRLAALGGHQLAAPGRLERLARGAGARHALPAHPAQGLRRLLGARLLLRAAAHHEPGLPRDLPGDEAQAARARQAEPPGAGALGPAPPRPGRHRGVAQLRDQPQREVDAALPGQAVSRRRRADRGQRRHHPADQGRRIGCEQQRDQRDGRWRRRRGHGAPRRCRYAGERDRLPVHRGAPAHLAVEGAPRREDAGSDNGRVRGLLAAVLPHVRHPAVLHELLPQREARLLHHLARLHQQRPQPAHLHHLQPRLPEGVSQAAAHTLSRPRSP